MGQKYAEPEPGEWVTPIRTGYKIACCDCALVHRIDFRIVKHGKKQYVQFRVFRHSRATAGMRAARTKSLQCLNQKSKK